MKHFYLNIAVWSFIIFESSMIYAVDHRKPENNSVHIPQTANCGPIALKETLKVFNQDVPLTQLIKDCKVTISGFCSMSDIKHAAEKYGLQAIPAHTNYEQLKSLKNDGSEIICYFSENHHFIHIAEVRDESVVFFDSDWSMNKRRHTLPSTQFKKEWKGQSLIITPKKNKIDNKSKHLKNNGSP